MLSCEDINKTPSGSPTYKILFRDFDDLHAHAISSMHHSNLHFLQTVCFICPNQLCSSNWAFHLLTHPSLRQGAFESVTLATFLPVTDELICHDLIWMSQMHYEDVCPNAQIVFFNTEQTMYETLRNETKSKALTQATLLIVLLSDALKDETALRLNQAIRSTNQKNIIYIDNIYRPIFDTFGPTYEISIEYISQSSWGWIVKTQPMCLTWIPPKLIACYPFSPETQRIEFEFKT